MLNEQEKREFVFGTLEPMTAYTFPYLTQVVGIEENGEGEYRGTGFFCKIGDRQAVVTAAHVLRDAKATGRFVSLAFTRGSGEMPTIVAGTIRYFDEIDLAVYLPDRDFPIGPHKAFWPDEKIERVAERTEVDYLFMQGFPARYSRISKLLGGLVSESLSSGAMRRLASRNLRREGQPPAPQSPTDPDILPDDLLRDHQFAFDFSSDAEYFSGPDGSTSSRIEEDWRRIPAAGEGQALPGQRPSGAHGLSGSPVWRIGASDGPIREWTTDASKLVGIVTHWNSEYSILIATSASKLLEIATDN